VLLNGSVGLLLASCVMSKHTDHQVRDATSTLICHVHATQPVLHKTAYLSSRRGGVPLKGSMGLFLASYVTPGLPGCSAAHASTHLQQQAQFVRERQAGKRSAKTLSSAVCMYTLQLHPITASKHITTNEHTMRLACQAVVGLRPLSKQDTLH
jgi:hypothetical protein